MRTHADHNTPSLFDPPSEQVIPEPVPAQLLDCGVTYAPDFLTMQQCEDLLAKIDVRHWQNDLKRRVQHYGWQYDYSSRDVTSEMKAEPLPDFLLTIAQKLKARDWFASVPDQVIINEYEPGQGIALHVDRDCFGPSVATLSLGDRWPMQLVPVDKEHRTTKSEEIFLDVGSVLVLRDDARTNWMHGIAKRKSDVCDNGKRWRRRRVSVTFRTVKFTT